MQENGVKGEDHESCDFRLFIIPQNENMNGYISTA